VPTISSAFIAERQIDHQPGSQALLRAPHLGVLVDGVAHKRVLVGGAGEQLDGEDIGVAVDDLAGEDRAHLRHAAGALAHPRQKRREHRAVDAEPQHDR
jgi:hypothetical protein